MTRQGIWLAKTRLAQAHAWVEGFGLPGAIPTIRNNPGDLRHSPHSQHPGGPVHANDIGTIDTIAHGWGDLERQMQLYAGEGMTLWEEINVYTGLPREAPKQTPSVDGNNTQQYLAAVLNFMGEVNPDTLVAELLSIPAFSQPAEGFTWPIEKAG